MERINIYNSSPDTVRLDDLRFVRLKVVRNAVCNKLKTLFVVGNLLLYYGQINFEPVSIQSNPILYCYTCNKSLSTSNQMPTTITTTPKEYIKLVWIYNKALLRFVHLTDKTYDLKLESERKSFPTAKFRQVLIIPFGNVWGWVETSHLLNFLWVSTISDYPSILRIILILFIQITILFIYCYLL